MAELTSTFTATPDGVLTAEAGVITGALELRSARAEDGTTHLTIRYAGAAEWYHLPGAPYHLHDPRDLETVHRLLVAVLSRPSAT